MRSGASGEVKSCFGSSLYDGSSGLGFPSKQNACARMQYWLAVSPLFEGWMSSARTRGALILDRRTVFEINGCLMFVLKRVLELLSG